MGLLRALFWSAVVAACTFAVAVFLQHGPERFTEGAAQALENFASHLHRIVPGRK